MSKSIGVALGEALAKSKAAKQANASKPAKQASAKVVKTALIGREAFAAHLSSKQVDDLEDFAVLCLDHQMEREAFTTQARGIVARVFAKPIEKAKWVAVLKLIKAELGDYAAKVCRDQYKAIHGALPSAGHGKTGSAVAGMSAKKFATGVSSRVVELAEYVAKHGKTVDVNAETLKAIAEAIEAAMAASETLQQAVNE